MVESFVRSGQPHQHVVVNVDKLVTASRDAELRRIIDDCALVIVDGVPVIWASRLLGKPLKERVAGVKRVYEQKFPGLTLAGFRNGYWRADEEAEVVAQIRAAKVDLLFVAFGSPKKEQFLARYRAEMRVLFAMGFGGTFDVVVGKLRRAPLWMQKASLEWFHRFLQEPRRMFRRYFIDDMRFFWLSLKEMARRGILA